MIEQRVSSRYARALLETANSEGLASRVYDDFLNVKAVFDASKELKSITGSPVFQNWRKLRIFREIFTSIKVSELVLNFLLLLLDKRRGNLVLNIIQQYNIQYNRLRNYLPVEIYSFVELNSDLKQKIIQKIADITGKTILPEFLIEPKMKGGLIVKIDDWVFDASIRQQLDNLYKTLAGEMS